MRCFIVHSQCQVVVDVVERLSRAVAIVAIAIVLLGETALAQGPTPTPVAVSVTEIGFVADNYSGIYGASFAVGAFFIVFNLVPTKRRSQHLMAFLCIEIFCAPIWIANIALWAGAQALFMFLYYLIDRIYALVNE